MMQINPKFGGLSLQTRPGRHRLSTRRQVRFVPASVILPILASLNCSGPQPLSTAIRPADESAYVERLNASNSDGRAAFFKWMAQERGVSSEELEKRDRQISTTRNPFDAHKDHSAVSRGAVLFKYHCARCHGEDARGKGPSALPTHPANDFHAFSQRFAATIHGGAPRRWFKSISEGYGDPLSYPDAPSKAMPAFGEKLSREQIWLVITYLQTLDAYSPRESKPATPQKAASPPKSTAQHGQS